jgi:diamine N-acetyltransferase
MLKGERVTLRAVERADLERWHALERNVELTMLGNGDWSPHPLAAFERNWEQRVAAPERAQFVIEIDGVVVGDCALQHQDRAHGTTQFGIAIGDPRYVGKGYGREALTLLLDWAFWMQGWRRVWCETFAVNERAIRMYRAVGMAEEGRQRAHVFFDGQYVDLVILGILRTEWDALRGR